MATTHCTQSFVKIGLECEKFFLDRLTSMNTNAGGNHH